MKVVGLIPARGGSKGLPGKNMKLLGGRPLIDYIISAAKSAQNLLGVYVSTDNDHLAEFSKNKGVRVIRHPPELSSDSSSTFGVIQNALRAIKQEKPVDALLTMRATSPFCLPSDIDNAIALLSSEDDPVDSVISVTASPVHPFRILKIQNGLLKHFGETTESKHPQQRQSFSEVFIRNGAIYATRARTIELGSLWGERSLPYVMPKLRSININDDLDFLLAEAVLSKSSDAGLV